MAVMLFPPGINQSPVIGRHDFRPAKSTNKSHVVVIFDHGNISVPDLGSLIGCLEIVVRIKKRWMNTCDISSVD